MNDIQSRIVRTIEEYLNQRRIVPIVIYDGDVRKWMVDWVFVIEIQKLIEGSK